MGDRMEIEDGLLPEGSTSLHVAVNNKGTSILSSLLTSPSPYELEKLLNQTDRHGRTPLAIALELGRSDAAALLIKNGADLNACVSAGSSRKLYHLLENQFYHPLVQCLLKEGARLPLGAGFVQVLLCSAVQTADEPLLKTLLEGYEVDVNKEDHLGSTALHYACQGGNTAIVDLLLDYGASATVQDSTGKTAVHIGCARGHLDVLAQILTGVKALDVSRLLNQQDISGRTCAHLALYCKQFEALAYLQNNYKLDLNLRDSNGHTLSGLLFYFRFHLNALNKSVWLRLPCLTAEEATWALHVGVTEGDTDLLVHSLTSKMAILDSLDFMNLSPLMWAARRGDLNICQVLTEEGAELAFTDPFGATALHHACYSNQPSVVKYLLDKNGQNLCEFFDTFCGSVTTGVLEVLLDYFSSHFLPQKPKQWQKWLSMAADNAAVTGSEFSMLVQVICPHDWLSLLTNNEASLGVSIRQTQQKRHSYLSLYRTRRSNEELYVNNMKCAHTAAFMKKMKCEIKLASERRDDFYDAMEFSKIGVGRQSDKPPAEKKIRGPNITHYYPLHDAARNGNVEVLDYVLDKAREKSESLLNTVLFQVKDNHDVSVAELMAVKLDRFAHRFNPSVVEDMGRRLGCKLPGSMTYAQALMHYLIVSTKPELFRDLGVKEKKRKFQSLKSVTPLDKWSLAYRRLMFCQCITAVGPDDAIGDPYHLSAEQRQELLVTLLKNHGLPDSTVYSEAGYMTLLCAAVKLRCVWAVRVLMRFGSSGLLHDQKLGKIWMAVCDILETAEVDLLQLLMGENSKSVLSDAQVEELCYGLTVLMSRNLTEWAERLYCDLVSRHSTAVWKSFRGPRLVLVCCLLHDFAPLGSLLVRDMLCTVCSPFLAYNFGGSKSYYQSLNQVKLAGCTLCLKSFREHCRVTDLPAACQILQSIQSYRVFFFYYLCMAGKYDAVKLVLDVMDTPYFQPLVRKLGKVSHTPLFFAIVNGHLDIIRLLFDSGCTLEGPGDGLMELTAAVLHIRLTKDRPFRPRVFYPGYVNCPIDNMELCGGNFSSEMIEYIISKSDFELVAKSPKLPLLLSEIASLSLCDLSHPILLELASCIQQPLQLGAAHANSVSNTLEKVLSTLSKRWKLFRNSLHLLDTVLCTLFCPCGFDFEIIRTASERGLWQLVMKLLPSAMHSDEAVLCILKNLIGQKCRDCFDAVCAELQKGGRTFMKGYSDVLCSAVNRSDLHAVVALLSLMGDCRTLVDPLKLSVSRHLNIIADKIVGKMVSVGAFRPELVLNCAARHNNSSVLEKFLAGRRQSLKNDEVIPWLTVLAEATRYGHQDIALRIASSIPVAEFVNKAGGKEVLAVYVRILCWSCYWGMADLLNQLPVSNEVLLKRPGMTAAGKMEDLTPWSYAEAGGATGKLATVDSLDLSVVDVSSRRNLDFILLGIFQKFFNLRKDAHASQSYDFDFSGDSSFIVREIFYGGEESIQILVDHMGASKPEFFQSVCKLYHCDNIFSALLKALCNKRGDPSDLVLLLRCLASSGISFDNNSKTVLSVVVCVSLGKVACVQAIIQYMPHLFSGLNKTYILESAVRSRNPKMVDCILEFIGDAGPDCCFPENTTNPCEPEISKLPYPLYTTFGLGCSRVICNSSLLSVASKVEGFELCKWKEASACNGWFRFMMIENSKIASQSCYPNVESSATSEMVPHLFSLRSVPVRDFKNSLLQRSTQWGVNAVTMAVLESTGGVLEQQDIWSRQELSMIADILTDKAVLTYLNSKMYCQDLLQEFVVQAKDLNTVHIAVNKLRTCQGSRDDVLELVHLLCGLFSDPLFSEKLFLHSCMLGLSTVVSHFVDTDFFDAGVLHRGLRKAILCCHYKIMAEIMVKLNVSQAAVKEAGGNELAQVIFSTEGYHSILNKFFHSVCDKNRRLPLAGVWLSYKWSRREAELVASRLGSSYAPPNPWNLSNEHGNMVITIDWNSFSEALLVSPSVTKRGERSLSQHVPMVVEAIVFSPAVLGQVVASFCNGGRAFDSLEDVALHSELKGFDNLIISCGTSLSPSLSSMGGRQGLLTIVYIPDTRNFVFPEVEIENYPLEVISPVKRFDPVKYWAAFRDPSEVISMVTYFDAVKNLAAFHERKVKSSFKIVICTSFSSEISNELNSLLLYGTEGERYYNLLSHVIRDFYDALTLIFKFSLPSLKLNWTVINRVELHFDHESPGQGQPVYSTEVAKSTLNVKIFLPSAVEYTLETSELCTSAFSNGLVEAMAKAIILEHVRTAESETNTEVVGFVNKAFSSSFGSSFDVTINLEDIKPSENETCTVSEAQCSVVCYVRQVRQLKTFLKLFCEMLENCKNADSCMRTSRRKVLSIVCLGNTKSEFVECNYRDFQMVISGQSLLNKRKLYDSLVLVWKSFLAVFTKEGLIQEEFLSLAAPVACYVDYQMSPGLLFPFKGKSKEITVQLVDHSGRKLESLPTENFKLKVAIRHCRSKYVIKGSFPATSNVSVLSFRDNSDGRVRIIFKPLDTGLHSIRIHINDIPIFWSTHKFFCVDEDASRTGFMFVSQHQPECPTSPVIKFYDKTPIRKNISPRRKKKPSQLEFLKSLEHEETHHMSICMAYGGVDQWTVRSTGGISIHLSNGSNCEVSCPIEVCSLGNGFHFVTLRRHSRSEMAYFVFASCPSCQSVMKMHLEDNSVSYCPRNIAS